MTLKSIPISFCVEYEEINCRFEFLYKKQSISNKKIVLIGVREVDILLL